MQSISAPESITPQPAAGARAGGQAQNEDQDHPTPLAAPDAPPVSLTDGHSWMEFAHLQKLYSQLPQAVRNTCATCRNAVNKLSTTQKVAGATALAGLSYLAFSPSSARQRGQH